PASRRCPDCRSRSDRTVLSSWAERPWVTLPFLTLPEGLLLLTLKQQHPVAQSGTVQRLRPQKVRSLPCKWRAGDLNEAPAGGIIPARSHPPAGELAKVEAHFANAWQVGEHNRLVRRVGSHHLFPTAPSTVGNERPLHVRLQAPPRQR